MGKKIVVFILLIATLCSLSLRANAADSFISTEDSKLVSDEIVSKIDPTGAGTVFRIYNTPIYYVFAHHDNIDSVLACREMLSEYYALKINGEYTYWRDYNGKYSTFYAAPENARAMEVFETGEVIGYIGSDVIVYNTYYLSGKSTHTGAAVYYRTNKGDYVYFKHYSVGERLFPVEAFCAFQKAVLNDVINNHSPDKVGSPDISQVWDLSPYDFRSDTFNLNAPIPGDDDSEQEDVDTPVIPDPPEEDGSADIKFQNKGNSLRLVTWVDSLNYKEIVFKVTIGGQTATIPCTTVYSSINAGDTKLDNADEIFNRNALYFATYTIENIPEEVTEFDVSVTWTDLEGNTRTSDTRTITL